MKKFALAFVAALAMAVASGSALAQHGGGHGGGGHGGGGHGGWSGGGHGGGGHWHGGGHYHGGWGWGGIYVGFPGYWGWGYPYWGYPYYGYAGYYPYAAPGYASYAVEPSTYVQQQAPEGAPGSSDYWYYCTDPAGYYPYVQNCSKSWMQVVPERGPNAPRVVPSH